MTTGCGHERKEETRATPTLPWMARRSLKHSAKSSKGQVQRPCSLVKAQEPRWLQGSCSLSRAELTSWGGRQVFTCHPHVVCLGNLPVPAATLLGGVPENQHFRAEEEMEGMIR